MKIPGGLLILLIALHRTTLIMASVKHKGKLLGESCVEFRDCGESSASFLICKDYSCQCIANVQYYQPEEKMCVSFVGQMCDVTQRDNLPPLVCGSNSECVQIRHERFGRCQCLPGYTKTSEQKCVAPRSQINNNNNNRSPFNKPSHPKPFPTGNQNHVAEPAQRNQHNNNNDKNYEEEEVVPSFPYQSANTHRSGVNSLHSSLKHYHYYHHINSNTVLSCLTIFFITRYILFL